MRQRPRLKPRAAMLSAWMMTMALCAGCNPTDQWIGGGIGVTALGAHSPDNEIEQIYYLGVFDPQEQVPPSVYRVRVHGQASLISNTRFASGWVRADLIDSLNTSVGFDPDTGRVQVSKGASDQLVSLQTGRRLMMFGPEGFREAPKDHRLVIVMGASPETFFQAIDQSLGAVSQAMSDQRNVALNRLLFEALTQASSERERLDELRLDVQADLAASTGGAS